MVGVLMAQPSYHLVEAHGRTVARLVPAEPERLSDTATKTLAEADQLAVAAISWFELAWLAAHERIIVTAVEHGCLLVTRTVGCAATAIPDRSPSGSPTRSPA
jgi:cysteine sulfinate desulfinase/cysteine desulfurase-like protein